MLKNIHFFFFTALFVILIGGIFFSRRPVVSLPNLDADALKGEMRLDARSRTPCPPNNPHCQPEPTATKKPPDPPTATKKPPDPTATRKPPEPPTSPPEVVNRAATKTALAATGIIVPTETSTNTPVADPLATTASETTPSPVVQTTEVTVVVSSTPSVPEVPQPTIVPFIVVLGGVLVMIYIFTRSHRT